jgi:hypothetical protein
MKRAALLLLAFAALAPAAERSDEWVSKRVRDVRASDVQAWRQIPWAADLLSASDAAKRDDRLLFIFSHEGNIDTGRC